MTTLQPYPIFEQIEKVIVSNGGNTFDFHRSACPDEFEGIHEEFMNYISMQIDFMEEN